MKLTLIRTEHNTYTSGFLYINKNKFCETLEDANRDINHNGKFDNKEKKIYGETCIPYGSYKVVLSYSPKFKRILPEILNVPEFQGIRIHRGNKVEDTLGCILCGEKVKNGILYNSTPYEIKLISLIQEAIQKDEEITLDIK